MGLLIVSPLILVLLGLPFVAGIVAFDLDPEGIAGKICFGLVVAMVVNVMIVLIVMTMSK